MTSPNATPISAVTAITSRKVTSGMAKRLRAALDSRHSLKVSSAQSTELVASALGYPSANHMAAALNAMSPGTPAAVATDPYGRCPYTVVLHDRYRAPYAIELVWSANASEAREAARAQYALRSSQVLDPDGPRGAPSIVAVFSGHQASMDHAEEQAWLDRLHAENCGLVDLRAAFDKSIDPRNADHLAEAREIFDRFPGRTTRDEVGDLVDLMDLKMIVYRMQASGAESPDEPLCYEILKMIDFLTEKFCRMSGTVGLRTGPVYGADPEMKLFQMTGAYGGDGGYWGAHVPARSCEEAVRITREIMTENSGEYEEGEIGEFEIVDQFDVSPREVATRDLVRNPDFNGWSSLERAARIELRAREYLQGAGM